jgi:glycosyltransferase involved in cell wall biosynthesis
VPNSVIVPDQTPPAPGADRVVYLGRLTRARGALDMIEVARRLPPGVHLELIGPADPDVAREIARAHRDHVLVHHGFIPNREALRMLGGALAGLALLHDEPNYADSRPTKVMEYMAFGVPVVAFDLPETRKITEGAAAYAPPGDVAEHARTIDRLLTDPRRRERLGQAGRARVRDDLAWEHQAVRYLDVIERLRQAA